MRETCAASLFPDSTLEDPHEFASRQHRLWEERMIKRVSLVRRLPELTRDEFDAHWSGPHVEIVRELPGLRGLRLGFVNSWTPEEAGWDGVGELWFDSRDAAEQAFATEPFASKLVEDRKLFLAEAQAAFVDELTIVPPPTRR